MATVSKRRARTAKPAQAIVDLQNDKLLSVAQAAEATGYQPQTLRNLICNRQGPPFIKLGTSKQSRVVFRRSDVEQWVSNRGIVGKGG
jgi:predicted DNA-binding transcriptional regulator AlpA